jgi:hypothetical protein
MPDASKGVEAWATHHYFKRIRDELHTRLQMIIDAHATTGYEAKIEAQENATQIVDPLHDEILDAPITSDMIAKLRYSAIVSCDTTWDLDARPGGYQPETTTIARQIIAFLGEPATIGEGRAA